MLTTVKNNLSGQIVERRLVFIFHIYFIIFILNCYMSTNICRQFKAVDKAFKTIYLCSANYLRLNLSYCLTLGMLGKKNQQTTFCNINRLFSFFRK